MSQRESSGEEKTWEIPWLWDPFSALRLGPSTIAVGAICVLGLVVFSIVDFRQIAYRRNEAQLERQWAEANRERGEFALWLRDKEKVFNSYLTLAGEFPEDGLAVSAPTVGADVSFEDLRTSIERMERQIRILTDLQAQQEDYFWYVPSISPINLEEDFAIIPGHVAHRFWREGLSRVSSKHGFRLHPITGKRQIHHGVDITCPEGTAVHAPANGIVTFVGALGANEDNLRHGYGKFVILQHGDTGFQTLFAHLSKITVQKGQLVKRGNEIAKSGQTGRATGPHLHYEVIRNGTRVNPLNYITDVALVERGQSLYYAAQKATNAKPRGGKKRR